MNTLQLQNLQNASFTNFFTCPLGENYSNSFFDKSKGLNNQEAEKMKSICSNHIFEPTLSNHFLQIDVDLIEKLIPCSLLGGPFGGPACPPVIVIAWKHLQGVYFRFIITIYRSEPCRGRFSIFEKKKLNFSL